MHYSIATGLASQNSKLRGELASYKLKQKSNDEDLGTEQRVSRESFSRERPTSSRAKTLEVQISSLQKMLTREKKHASESSTLLDRYQKRIQSLELALRNSASVKKDTVEKEETAVEAIKSDDGLLQKQLLSLTNENKNLKHRIKDLTLKSDSSTEAQVKQLKAENDALKKENERLSQVGKESN